MPPESDAILELFESFPLLGLAFPPRDRGLGKIWNASTIGSLCSNVAAAYTFYGLYCQSGHIRSITMYVGPTLPFLTAKLKIPILTIANIDFELKTR